MHYLLEAKLVHELEALEGLLYVNSNKVQLKRNRAERIREGEKVLRLHAEECGHVAVVGQRR